MSQTTYLIDTEARDHIRSRGVRIGNNALKDHRSRGTGPKWVLINGRALYTREWCDEWIDAQAARPPSPRQRKDLEQADAS
jgi:hypothetical protein